MYSIVSIRNMFKLSHLAVVEAIHSGYVNVQGDGENIDSYYTDKKGFSYFKRLVSNNIGGLGVTS